jgi:uncharacterized protein (DUF927 family)
LEDLYVWRRIAKTRIDPEALSYDTSPQRNWQHRFLVTGEIGQSPVDIDAEYLGETAKRAINMLVRRGVHIVESLRARQHLAKFLRFRPRGRIVRAPRIGWFQWPRAYGPWVFVLAHEVLGATDKVRIILDPANASDGYGFHRAGTSEQWRQEVAIPLAGNSNVVLAIGLFLAAPLLYWADEPAGGFHFHGDSTIGKTLVCACGQSVWGRPFVPRSPAPDAFGYDWHSTSGRLEERAVLRNDVGLYLDEIGVGDGRAISKAIYELVGGLGKGRMRGREAVFNILLLSTGEQSIADFLGDARAGQLVRLSDIPAKVQPGTAFERFQPDEAGRRFYPAIREYHGTAGHEWLQYLVGQTPKKFKPRLSELQKTWLARSDVTESFKCADSQVRSVINRFALVAAALAMAIEAQILPWSQADTDVAIIACMQRWLNQRGNIDAAGELLRQIERRRKELAATINDRFIHLRVEGRRLVPASAADQEKMNAADQSDGYVKDGQILVTPKAWESMWDGLDIKAVNKHLLREKLLIPDREGKVPSVERYKSGERPTRFYVLASTFIEVTA